MKTWHAVINPRVEHRLFDILSYVNDEPLFNPDAALSILEDYDINHKTDNRSHFHLEVGAVVVCLYLYPYRFFVPARLMPCWKLTEVSPSWFSPNT